MFFVYVWGFIYGFFLPIFSLKTIKITIICSLKEYKFSLLVLDKKYMFILSLTHDDVA